MENTQITFTREALYDQVWSEPMTRLALKYKISDVGLRKICLKMDVPTPVSGYWAKISAGKKVAKIPLPVFDKNKHAESYIYNPATEEKRTLIPQEELDAALSPINKIRVHEQLNTRNAMVLETKQAYRSAHVDKFGMAWAGTNVLHLRVSPECVDRSLRIMDAILKGFAALNFNVENEQKEIGTFAVVHGEKVHFSIEEKVKRSDHVITEKEKGLTYHTPKWDFHPTGILSLVIKNDCGGGQRVWKDDASRIEDNLNGFFKSTLLSARAIRANRIRREESDRRWEAERQRQAEEKQKQQQEQLRFQQLENQATMWSKSEVLRSYIRQVEQQVTTVAQTQEVLDRFEAWKRWAVSHADRVDPLSHGLPF